MENGFLLSSYKTSNILNKYSINNVFPKLDLLNIRVI